MSKAKRINGNIEGLRFIFALMIAIMHFWGNYYGDAFFLNGAYIFVEFFFIVSGFFLAMTMEKSDIGPFRFTIRKWYALFWVYELSILARIAIHTRFEGGLFTRLISSVPDMLGLQMSGIFYPSVNGILWYVSAMLISGFFISYLYKRYTKIFVQLIAPFMVVAGYAFIYSKCGDLDARTQDVSFIPLGLIRAAAGMSLGTIVYYIYKRLSEEGFFEKPRIKPLLSAAELAGFGLLLVCMLLKPHSPHDFKCLICFPVILICAYSRCTVWGSVSDALGNILTKIFGKQYTLTIYCFSVSVCYFVIWIFGNSMGLLKATAIYLILLIVISWIVTFVSGVLGKKLKINI